MSLDPAKVATELGIALDERVTDCTLAAEAWVEKRRCLTDPTVLWADAAVERGGVQYAALLHKQRSQPQGFAGMDSLGNFIDDTGATMSQVFRLVGADVVVA